LEYPILRLALLGFDVGKATRLAQWAGRSEPGWPVWRVSSPDKADAWCINGQAITRTDEDGRLTVNTYWPKQPQISLDPLQTERPIALAMPLPDGLEAAERVNVDSESQVRVALQRFEAWLRPLRTQFALGAALLANQRSLGANVYHLKIKHTLVAVIDLVNLKVGLSPTTRPVDMEEASWEKRPQSAADIPAAFIKMTLAQLMWTYAMRTERDTLPERYRTQKIYQRGLSGVPVKWVQDEQLMLMSELKVASATLDELVSRTGMLPSELSRYLAALYFAGMVTTNPGNASKAKVKPTVGDLSSLPPSSNRPSDFHTIGPATARSGGFGVNQSTSRGVKTADVTAPVGLESYPRKR
jgi:DprA winged helix domain